MAHVGGPTNLLPGQKTYLPLNTCCDTHPEAKAVTRIVGEVDSFGYEAMDMCSECYANFQTSGKLMEGICDWCKSSDTNLTFKRDYEEGSTGPVYRVCEACIKEQADIIDQEIKEQDDTPEYEEDFSPDDFDYDESDKTD